MTATPVPPPAGNASRPPRGSRAATSSHEPDATRRGPARRHADAALLSLAAIVLSILPLALFYLSAPNPDLPAGDLIANLNRWGVRFTGILCGVLMFWQLLLMAHADVVERTFHRQHLKVVHVVFGIAVPVLLLVHIGVRTIGHIEHPEPPATSPWESIRNFFLTQPAYYPAVAAAVIAFTIALASTSRARRRLRRVRWHRLHLLAYVALVAALPHELVHGTTFGTGGLITGTALTYWVVVTVFTLAVVAWYRLRVPAKLNRDFPLVVISAHVVGTSTDAPAGVDPKASSPGQVQVASNLHERSKQPHLTWEVTLQTQGRRGLTELGLRAGQYLDFTFCDQPPRTGWLTGRSLTPTLRDGRLVLAVDLHQDQQPPEPGQQVLIAGPYGLLTVDVLSSEDAPVLLAVSGTGVASARALIDDLLKRSHHVTVLHRVRPQELQKWQQEFSRLQSEGRVRYVPVIDEQREKGCWLPAGTPYEEGPEQWLAKNVDHIRRHEAFVVGSSQWVKQVRTTLRRLGVDSDKIHWE